MPATVTWFGHATFRLILPDERVIWIDPWLKENPACPPGHKQADRCDLLLLTHGHFDHVGDVEPIVKKFKPKVVANLELCSILEKRFGTGTYCGMNTGGTQVIDGVRVSLTQAFHSSSVDAPDGPIYAGMPNGVVVSTTGVAPLYHAGDTDVFSDMKLIADLFAPKICILPIGDHFTMGATGAALAAQLLQPSVIVPMHYGSFPVLAQSPDDFRRALPADLRERLHVLEVGKPVTWTAEGLG